MSYLYSVVSVKMLSSGLNVMVVPRSEHSPMTSTCEVGAPLLYVWRYIFPSRLRISAISSVESAFTHDTPTPCRPPETL